MSEKRLGIERVTDRGFRIVEFFDRYGIKCSLQASSLAEFEEPGTSAVWLGPNEPNAQIMASQAKRLGVKTDATSGWIPYPLPEEVQTTTRMHLDREQVQKLIDALTCWLANGRFADQNAVEVGRE